MDSDNPPTTEARTTVDLGHPRAIHVVGVGGAGMSAIASVLAAMGHTVTGSDLRAGPAIELLRAKGVAVAVGHAGANVGSAEVVAISTAVPASNPEVQWAREHGVAVVSRAAMLSAITRERRTLAVAGTHGKTTTSSMLAKALIAADADPSFIIGGELNDVGSGAWWGSGEHLVVEADESDGTFLDLARVGAIVTNVEPDHLEFYGGFAALERAFERFVRETPGPVVVCADDPGAAALAAAVPTAVTYGTDAGSTYRITRELHAGANTFAVTHGAETLVSLTLPVPGAHNARNATAALALVHQLGLDVVRAAHGLEAFAGVARRFQFRGERGGVCCVDDYAHLPSETRAAIAAGREGPWDRVVVVFQPHRFSRTENLWRDFADAFVGADVLVLLDVYGAGEPPRPGVTGRLIDGVVRAAHPETEVHYVERRDSVAEVLAGIVRPRDLCLTLGAGDVTTVASELLSRLDDAAGPVSAPDS